MTMTDKTKTKTIPFTRIKHETPPPEILVVKVENVTRPPETIMVKVKHIDRVIKSVGYRCQPTPASKTKD